MLDIDPLCIPDIDSYPTDCTYHLIHSMFFTDRLMLRGIDPEVDNAIFLQWTNNVEAVNSITTSGPHPWSRERAKQLVEGRTKNADALPWFIICERPTPENEPTSVLGPNDDYYRTADSQARYPAIGMLTMTKIGGATDVSRTVAFGILFDQSHQGNHLRSSHYQSIAESCRTVQPLNQEQGRD